MRLFLTLIFCFCLTSNLLQANTEKINNWNAQFPKATDYYNAEKYEKALDIFLSLETDLDALKIKNKDRFNLYSWIANCYGFLENVNSPKYIETIENRILYLTKAYNSLKKTDISTKILNDNESNILQQLAVKHGGLFGLSYKIENIELAEKYALKTLNLSSTKKDKIKYYNNLHLLGMVYNLKGEEKKIIKHDREILKQCKKIWKDNLKCYSDESALAHSLKTSGSIKNIMEAKKNLEELINTEKNYSEEDFKRGKDLITTNRLSNRINLAHIYEYDLNDINTAEKYMIEALSFVDFNKHLKDFGGDDLYIDKVIFYNQFLDLYRFLGLHGNYNQGIEGTSKIKEELKENNLYPNILVRAYLNLADLYGAHPDNSNREMGIANISNALKMLLEAKKIIEKYNLKHHLNGRIGSAYQALGSYDRAEKFFQASIYDDDGYFINFRNFLRLAQIQLFLGKNQLAKKNLNKAEKILTKHMDNHPQQLDLHTFYLDLYSPGKLNDPSKFDEYLIKSYTYISDYSKGLIQKKYDKKTMSKTSLQYFKTPANKVLAGILNEDDRFKETSDLFVLKTNKNIQNVIIELIEINRGSKINESVQNLIDRSENTSISKDKKELQTLIIKYEKSKKISDNAKEQKELFQNLQSIKKEISDKKEIILSKLNSSTLSNYSKEIDIQNIQNTLSSEQAIVSYYERFISVITKNNVYFKKIEFSSFGLGITVKKEKNIFYLDPKPHFMVDTPALRAGVKKDDILLEIDGQNISEKTLDEIYFVLTDPIKSRENFTFKDPSKSSIELTIQRNETKKKIIVPIGKIIMEGDEFSYRIHPRVNLLISNVRNSLKVNNIGEISDFNIKDSEELYKLLIDPIKSFIKDKKELIIIPDKALLSIPFEVLIDSEDKNVSDGDYKNINWLGKKYAINYYPSIYSFYNLNQIKFEQAKNDFLGFGDPYLKAENKTNEIDYTKLFTRGVANADEIRKMSELPETADELKFIAQIFEGSSKLYLGENFNEEVVKTSDLNNYKFISFATHAVVANQINNIAEPGLILTPPDKPNKFNDGILTVSEIEKLNLQSDVVILSACNTAAEDGSPNAEGLSGLASAFFQAGTKSILVTHWDVETNSAVRLTTGTFSKMKETKNLSQALHQTKLEMLNNKETSHPIFWAPFVLIGNVTQTIN